MASFTYLILIATVSLVYGQDFENDGTNDTMHMCWRDTYSRGVGSIPNHCKDGWELNGLVCYPECKANYTGVGPVCWQNCPSGFHDEGLKCVLPEDKYHPCPWYDICGVTVAKGCLKCKPGYKKEGCSCKKPGKIIWKKSYKRGAGEAPGCAPNKTEDAGLCYPLCKEGWDGVGPICWKNGSGNVSYEFQCNLFAYGQSQADCKELNSLLEQAGITTPICIGSLVASIITGHVVGPKICRHLIEQVLPKLVHTKACSDINFVDSSLDNLDFGSII